MALLYAVTAHVVEEIPGGIRLRHAPAFLLNADSLGIVSKEHAESIARSILNPTDDDFIHVVATAQPWREV